MKVLTLLAVAGTGAALAYLLDPQQGRQRRAMVRDKLRTAQERAPKIARDLRNRAHGVVAETRRFLGRPEPHRRSGRAAA